MRMDPGSYKPKQKKMVRPPRGALLGIGVGFVGLAVVMLGLSLWEAFGGFSGKIRMVELPGFHELDLENPGLYAGIYQHRSRKPLPVKALSSMDVRIMAKDSYEEVPVLMNNTGQTISRFGIEVMPLFNFVVQQPGAYTMSAVYLGDQQGPKVPVTIVAQAAANIKQTLIVGASFFVLFLGLGILILVKLDQWAPKA